MGDSGTAGTPAGWYLVEDGQRTRYWDGERWTDQFGPASGQSAAPPPVQQAYGAPAQKESHTVRNILLVVVGLFVLTCGGCLAFTGALFNEADKAIDKAEKEVNSPTEGDLPDVIDDDDASFENGVLTTPELRIKITRYEIIKVGQKGNEYGEKPVIAFWYKITNLTDKDVDPMSWIYYFNAFQDNNPNAENELDVGSLPDDRFIDSQMENIKKGGTVENAMAYELDDLVTPVELVAVEGLGLGDDIGSATYKLK